MTTLLSRILGLSRRVPREELPVAAVGAANAILDVAWAIGSETNAPRLQRLVMLCDRACLVRTGRRLVEERPTVFADMPFHSTVHDAFRRWNAEPITDYGRLREIDCPHLVRIDAERLAVIDEVVRRAAPMTTWSIPRIGDDVPLPDRAVA